MNGIQGHIRKIIIHMNKGEDCLNVIAPSGQSLDCSLFSVISVTIPWRLPDAAGQLKATTPESPAEHTYWGCVFILPLECIVLLSSDFSVNWFLLPTSHPHPFNASRHHSYPSTEDTTHVVVARPWLLRFNLSQWLAVRVWGHFYF